MSIDRLRYFAAVVETKNLRRASQLVGIAPASMSKAVSLLCRETGFRLLRPQGRGIEITERGIQLYKASLPLLHEYRRFEEQVQGPELSEKPLGQARIATFEVFSTYFLTRFFEKMLTAGEALVTEAGPGEIEEAVLNRTVDFGITYLPQPSERLEFSEIGSFQMRIFGRPKWKGINFNEWPFAVPTTPVRVHVHDEPSLDLWPKSCGKRQIKYRFELLETALQTSRTGLSVIHCPDFIVRIQNQVVKPDLRLEELPYPRSYKSVTPRKVYLVSRVDEPHRGQLERKLATFMRSLRSSPS